MESLELEPGLIITNDRCLILEGDGRTAVLGDLHLGYEKALEEQGMYIPRTNTDSIRDNLNRILSKYEPDRVVLLGDIKHDFRRSRYEAKKEIEAIIRLLSEESDVIVIRGNHDNFIQNAISDEGLLAVDYLDMGGYRLEHGHMDSGKRPVIIGHEHPSVRIKGAMSGSIKLQCYAYARKEGVLVLPPFSPFASGNDLSTEPGCVMADALKKTDLPDVEIFGVSEVGILPLGPLSSLDDLVF